MKYAAEVCNRTFDSTDRPQVQQCFAFDPDSAAVERFLKDESVRKLLIELGERYSGLQDFTEPETEKLLRDFAAEKGVKAGALINGARVALTGRRVT